MPGSGARLSSCARNRRRRASILVQTETTNVLVDTSPDLREQCLGVGLRRIDGVLYTHAHADHISAAPYLQDKLGGKLAIGREIIRVQEVFGKLFNAGTDFERDGSQFDKLFDDGETFQIGELEGIALHVPGHTPADMAFSKASA